MSGKSRARANGARIDVHCAGREFVLFRRNDLETLWQEMIADPAAFNDERLPYWCELWPATLALADWLWEKKDAIAGRACLDVGCGLGFLTILGAFLGARALGMDYEPQALEYCQKNARSNGIKAGFALMDWRNPALRPGSLEYIWGSDIMYEARFKKTLADFLNFALAPAGIAWLADPGRSFFADFVEELQKRGLGARTVFRTTVGAICPQDVNVPVRIWQIDRGL